MATPIDLDKMRSIGVLGRRTVDQRREWRDDDGRHKAVTDELGNTVTQHARVGGDERQDVLIRAPRIQVKAATQS